MQEIDINENSCLIAACKTQALKTEVIERRLLSVTYTGQSMPALKAVSQHLDAAEAEAEANLQQVSCFLPSSPHPASSVIFEGKYPSCLIGSCWSMESSF